MFLLSSAIIIYQFLVQPSLLSNSVFCVFEPYSCFIQANLVVLTCAYEWHSLLISLSQTLPEMKCLMPLTQLITALTSFPILFTSNYSWYQLWEYWGELSKHGCVELFIFLICMLLRCAFCFLNALELLLNVLFGVLNLFLASWG